MSFFPPLNTKETSTTTGAESSNRKFSKDMFKKSKRKNWSFRSFSAVENIEAYNIRIKNKEEATANNHRTDVWPLATPVKVYTKT